MRRSIAALVLAAASLVPAIAAADVLTAPLGRAVRVPLAAAAADVVVGDPKIADVTVVSPTVLFVSGKAFGSTNLVVLDRTGRTIFDGRVQVPLHADGQVSISRGAKAATYFCAPNCNMLPEEATSTEIAMTTPAAAPGPAAAAPSSTPAP